MKKIVILGVGNVLEKDDGIGVYTSVYLKENFIIKNVNIINGGVDGINLLNVFLDNDQIIILDTIEIDDEAGSIYNIPSFELSGMGINVGGAHEVGVLQCLDMIELLDKKIPESNIIAIIPENITFEFGLSETLHVKFQEYIGVIVNYLKSCGIEVVSKKEKISLEAIIKRFSNPSGV